MKEALKLALEVLKGLKSMYGGNGHKLHEINMIHRKHDTAITALEEALAQPEQEPVQTTQTSIVFYNGNSPSEESEVLRITKDGITVNPAFKPDEAAAAVLRALDSQIKNLMTQPEQEHVEWRNAALRVGEDLCSVGPFGYYDMTAEQWLDWALSVVTVHAPPPPPQRTWVGLTDEKIEEIAAKTLFPVPFARAIEAELKENT